MDKIGGIKMITGKLANFPYWGWGNPLEELARIRQEMNRLVGDTAGVSPHSDVAGVFPLVNIYEDTDGYTICAELPGLTHKDVEISAKGQSLNISGERKIRFKGENARYHRRERQAGTFNRAIALPSELNMNKIDARMKNGILTIRAQKAEKAKPKAITVK
jgi:HSP20 family protein